MKTSKLIRALIAGGLIGLASVSSFAAGLGRLTVHSSLGQPLVAEIELLSVQKDEISSIVAKVATPEAFQEAKIEYSPTLQHINFSVDTKPNGQPYLRVTSTQPISEPFVDMLVELNWSAGRLVREFPVLLDPPGFTANKSPAVATASVPTASTKTQKPVADVQRNKSAPATSTSAGTIPNQYTVKSGDSLSKIAGKVKQNGVNLDQMLVALFRENKHAFVGDNMNRLRTRSTLKVPSAEQAGAISASEARKEILAQSGDWNAYREKLAGRVASSAAKPSKSSQKSTGKIGSAVVEQPAPSAAGPKDVLKISRGDGKVQSTKVDADEKNNALREEATARASQMKEDKARIAQLEKNIADMERLLAVKNQSMAELQKQADAAKAAKPETPPAVSKKAAEVTPPVAPVATQPKAVTPIAPEPKPNLEPIKPSVQEKAVTPDSKATADAKPALPVTPITESKSVAETKRGTEPRVEPDPKPALEAKPADSKPVEPLVSTKPQSESVVPGIENKAAEEKPIAKPMPPAEQKKAAPPPAEPSFMESLIEEPSYMVGGAGIGALLLGLLAYVAFKKKNDASPKSTTSSLASDLKSDGIPNAKSSGVVDTGNSSFLTDFEKTGPGIIDVEEVDPVAEAEVYIAYGRDAQAEEILKEAMAKDDSRPEIPLKLLEIYASRKSVSSFESVAKQLHENVGSDHPIWKRASDLGRQLDPSNSLYQADGDVVQATATPAETSAFLEDEIKLPDISEPVVADENKDEPFSATIESAAPEIASEPEISHPAAESSSKSVSIDDLDFDLDLPATPATTANRDLASDNDELTSVHNEPVLDLPLDEEKTPTEDEFPRVAAENNSLDFDLGGLDLPKPVPDRPEPPAFDQTMLARPKFTAQFTDDDLDLSDFNASEKRVATPEVPLAKAPEIEENQPPAAEEQPFATNTFAAPELPLPDLSLDIDSPIIPKAVDTAASRPNSTTSPSSSLDLGGLNLNLSPASLSLDGTAEDNVDSEWHSVATKLDLAKAYLEIGDKDGAKEILQEVLQEGDSEQKRQAEELTAGIA